MHTAVILIDTIQFVELEQTLGTTSIEIVPDENRVTVYENKGNDVYENEFDNEFEEYKLSELVEQLEKIEIAPESEKSTITVDEDDILRMSAKIQQNKNEDIRFAEQVDKFIEGKLKNYETLSLGTTPNVLYLLNSKSDSLTMNQNVLKNSLNDESQHIKGHSSGHDIPVDILKKIPEAIRNPICISAVISPSLVFQNFYMTTRINACCFNLHKCNDRNTALLQSNTTVHKTHTAALFFNSYRFKRSKPYLI